MVLRAKGKVTVVPFREHVASFMPEQLDILTMCFSCGYGRA